MNIIPKNPCYLTVKNIAKSENRFPKSLIVFFFISQFVFGINFGFSQMFKKKYRLLARCLTAGMSLLHIINLAIPLIIFKPFDINFLFNIVEYPSYFIVLNTLTYTVYNFLYDMHNIHGMRHRDRATLKIIALFYLMFMYIIKMILNIVDCFNKNASESYCLLFNFFHYILYNISDISMDPLAVTQILIYYYFKCHARYLKELLIASVKNLKLVERKYLLVADCYDKIGNLYDKMTILELFIGVPKMMLILWWMLVFVKNDVSIISVLTQLTFGSHIASQIALPAITAELLNSEMDAIKRLLNDYLRSETDEKIKADVNRVLRYIESRPLRHLVLRFIPTDLRQILSVIGLCTTYFIVIIQFTHLVD